MREFPVEYLPAAIEDLDEIYDYIAGKLHAPQAADRFLDAMDEAAERISRQPFLCPVYGPPHPLKYEVRKLVIRHFLAFYEVDMEEERILIHRVVYGPRNPAGIEI